MTSAHVFQGLIPFGFFRIPVQHLPFVINQPRERIADRNGGPDAVALFSRLSFCNEIMWIAEHIAVAVNLAKVDFLSLLRPNSR